MNTRNKITITLSALAFLMLSVGVAQAAGLNGMRGLNRNIQLSNKQANILEEARELRRNGDVESAKELILNSDLPAPMFGLTQDKNRGRGINYFNNIDKKEIHEAIASGDYDRFVELSENCPMHVEVDEETFNKLVEAHSLRMEGDYIGARAIIDELGWGQKRKLGNNYKFN